MADYGVVLLSCMAHAEGEVMTAPQLAEATGLSGPTVAKVLKLLVDHGLVLSHRGVKGGYELAREPVDIDVLALITALEGPVALTACVDGLEGLCTVEMLCPLRGRWDLVNAAIRSSLERITLEDLMAPPDFLNPEVATAALGNKDEATAESA